MNDKWQERKRPPRLERRYQFPDYETLRDFLDRAADLSEAEDFYPDLNFGRDYANITIHAADGADAVDSDRRRFAEKLDELYSD